MTPTIAAIETTIFRLPLHGALRWGRYGRLDELRHVLVRVRLSDGAVGVTEAPPRPTIYGETPHSITGIIAQELAPRLVGQAATDLSPLRAIRNNHAAKAAVDIATHDALAQSRGQDLLTALHAHVSDVSGQQSAVSGQRAAGSGQQAAGGGQWADKIRVSYILGIGDEETVLAEARRVFGLGVRVLKVKVGRDWPADLRRIRALQDEFGAEMAIYTDANECLTAVDAPRRLAQLAEMGVLYCEEPLPVEQVRARAALRAGGHLPLIGDDSAFTVRDLRRELALDTFDILNVKTARTGYTESAQMLAMARAAGKGVMVGSQACAALGTARAGLFAALPGVDHPSELSFFLKLKADIVRQRPLLRDGFISVADLAAVKIDDDLLRDAAID